MIKLVYCIRKRDDISEEEFHRYWLEDHGPLVKSVADDIGACRYVQSHTGMADINDMLRATTPFQDPFDGITEVWRESEDAFRAGLASEAGQAADLAVWPIDRPAELAYRIGFNPLAYAVKAGVVRE